MITLGKSIYSILSNNSTITGYTGTNIFPLVIPEGKTLPCIVYERNSDLEHTKDRTGVYSSLVDITILSEEYTECINITEAVFNALENYTGSVQGIDIIDIRLDSVNETFQESAYIQKLAFRVRSR